MKIFMECAKKTGYTLVELLVGAVITTITVGIIAAIFSAGNDLWEVKRTQADLQGQARTALEQMTSELRRATRISNQSPSPDLDIPSSPNNKDINFYLPADMDGDGNLTNASGAIEWNTSNQIKYQYVPGQKELRRLEKGDQTILARDVSDVHFIDAGINNSFYDTELKIILNLSKTTPRGRNMTTAATAIVKLRN